jgi:mono/diheme cytochrome c family protein
MKSGTFTMRSPHGWRLFVLAAGVGGMLTLGTAQGVAAAGNDWLSKVPLKEHARTNPLAGRPQAVEGGAFLYREHCAQCHRANAEGDGKKKPSLKTGRIRKASDGDLEWFLRQGDLAHGMPSWSNLPEAQRWQIIAYLRTLR